MGFEYNPYGSIQNDQEAEDLILQMKEHMAERERLKDVCKDQIRKYQDKIADIDEQFTREASYPLIMLKNYAIEKANKITKTKKSYALPSGVLVIKHQAPEYKRDEKSLFAWVKENAKRFIKSKVVESTDWESMKKEIIWDEDGVMLGVPTDDGELLPVDGLEVVERDDVFLIE